MMVHDELIIYLDTKLQFKGDVMELVLICSVCLDDAACFARTLSYVMNVLFVSVIHELASSQRK